MFFVLNYVQAFGCTFRNSNHITSFTQFYNGPNKTKTKKQNKTPLLFSIRSNNKLITSCNLEMCRNATVWFYFQSTLFCCSVYFIHILGDLLSCADHKNSTVTAILEDLREGRVIISIFIILYKGKGLCAYLSNGMREEGS